MEQNRIPKPGEIYNHFKNKQYQIITVAVHSETQELMVVYQALYGEFKTYVRPLQMFISEVDRLKYPEVKQSYRFERKVTQEELVSLTEVEQNSYEQPEKEAVNQGLQYEVPNNKEIATEINSLLIKFLDAESYTRKLEILTTNKANITDRVINDMAVSLDCAVDDGPIEVRIQELITCLETKRRFEDRRIR